MEKTERKIKVDLWEHGMKGISIWPVELSIFASRWWLDVDEGEGGESDGARAGPWRGKCYISGALLTHEILAEESYNGTFGMDWKLQR